MLKAAVLVFDEVEVLDFCGPFEVLASTRAPGAPEGGERAFDVYTVAASPGLVRCRGGLLVQPNHTFADAAPPDLLVVPGGYGVLRAIEDQATVEWVRRVSAGARLTTSVCTGAFLL